MPSDDLDVAVELVNTVYVLDDPPDRLTDVEEFRAILVAAGQHDLADTLTPADLPRLRRLRERIRPVFGAATAPEAASLVNGLLRDAVPPPRLALDGARLALVWGAGATGYEAVRARLTGALADHLARQGVGRLGVCAAAPCTCVFVDRTRPRTRRYCCDGCNDRAAAAAYYRRKRGTT